MCHACGELITFQVMNFSRSKKKMNLSTETWKDIVYSVVSTGVFCRTQMHYFLALFHSCSVAVSFYMLERTPL